MDYQTILLNVAIEQGLPIAVTVIGGALTAGAAWLGVRANKYLGVKIDAQLNTLFHAALTRLAEATVAEMAKGDARGGTAIGAKVVPGVAGRVAGQIMATMPGTLKKMGITDAASPVLIRLAQQAVERALAK